jgi:hypothetical protein
MAEILALEAKLALFTEQAAAAHLKHKELVSERNNVAEELKAAKAAAKPPGAPTKAPKNETVTSAPNGGAGEPVDLNDAFTEVADEAAPEPKPEPKTKKVRAKAAKAPK